MSGPRLSATFKVKAAIIAINVLYAILLSSIGVVILQMINAEGIAPRRAGVLEAFKDLPIALSSLLLASWVPRLGYRRSMLTALAMVCAASVIMALGRDFTSAKIFFLISGTSFALAKISMYSAVGIICPSPRDHAGFMSLIEGFFMVGALAGFWLFGWFMRLGSQADGTGWFWVYWVILALTAGVWMLVWWMPLDESDESEPGSAISLPDAFKGMLDLARKPIVIVFLFTIALYLAVEQSVNSWLPSFNNKVLLLSDDLSVTLVSLYAGSIAAGRMLGGWLMRRVDWHVVLLTCMVSAILTLVLVLPLASAGNVPETAGMPQAGTGTGMNGIPLAGWLLPLVGLFIAPVYPALSSTMLSSLPRSRQSGMTGLLIVFTAMGGTTGSLATGYLFGALGGVTAFHALLAPLIGVIALLLAFRRMQGQASSLDLPDRTARQTA